MESGVSASIRDKYLTWLGAFAGADEAAGFEDVHHARGTGVAEAEAALQQGGASFLFLTHDLDAFDDEFFIDIGLIAVFIITEVSGFDGFVNVGLKIGFAEGGAVIDEAFDLGIGYEGSLRSFEFCRAWW